MKEKLLSDVEKITTFGSSWIKMHELKRCTKRLEISQLKFLADFYDFLWNFFNVEQKTYK